MSEEKKDFIAAIIQMLNMQFEKSGYETATNDVMREEIKIEMRDGKKMYAVVFKPVGVDGPFPTILERTCYPMGKPFYETVAAAFAKRGYAFVESLSRGTGESEGVWQPNVNERKDGIDTVDWLLEQDWVKNLGYYGSSYSALCGWAIADLAQGKVRGMYLDVYGCDRFRSLYEKGLFRHDIMTAWTMQNAGFPITADYLESCRYRPHDKVDAEMWGRTIPWYQDYIHATKRTDAYWQSGWWKTLIDIPQEIRVPLYITEGWYDHHLASAISTYGLLSEKAKQCSWLDIGCWNHNGQNCLEWDTPKNLDNGSIKRSLKWFDLVLKQERVPQKRIRAYSIREDTWKEYAEFPFPPEDTQVFFLDGTTRSLTDGETGGSVSFDYDPENPVMTHGGETLLTTAKEVGSKLQPEPGWRADVISFISEPLKEEIKICGKMQVQLAVSTDVDDTAFSAKIIEVFPDGKAYNIRSGITTVAADMPEGRAYMPGEQATVYIDLTDIAWTAQPGSRIRLDISSSDFPQYAIHSNYAGCWAEQEKTRVAHQTIHCDTRASKLIIPVSVK